MEMSSVHLWDLGVTLFGTNRSVVCQSATWLLWDLIGPSRSIIQGLRHQKEIDIIRLNH